MLCLEITASVNSAVAKIGGMVVFKVLFFVLLGLVALFSIVTVPRTLKDAQRKRETANAYAIQNIETGKNIRVHNAGIDDGRKIVLYPHRNWECITWQFIQLEENVFLLKNLYTHKTFQPSSTPEAGVTLWQQPLGGDRLQYWEFIKQSDDAYFIRLKDTDLYITISSSDNHSDIILMPLQNTPSQMWTLIEQRPIF
jgi:hypothetical protein